MPLGIEYSSTIPQMIQGNSAALVQGIRQIGQQVSAHLTEMQTKRDLAAMAQEVQGLNVQSNDFPIQLAQLTGRHPLAAKDDRAKMLLLPLGAAHAQWQAGEAEARAFNRAMAMQTRRTQDARTLMEEKTHLPQNVPGVGLTIPNDPVTGQPNVLIPAQPRSGTSTPFRSTPQGIMDARTGEITKPAPKKEMTEYQRAQMRRNERKDQIAAINQEINQFDSDIASAVHQYESSFKREQDASTPEEKTRHQMDKTEVGKIADRLKAEKAKRLELLKKLRDEDTRDAAILPDEELLPVPSAAAEPSVLPSLGEIPTVMSVAEAKKLPKGTQFKSPDGKIRIAQ